MRTIHCIAIDPDTDSGSVGGSNWRVRHEAMESLYLELQMNPDYDNCRLSVFEVRVPEWTSNQEITELVDEKAWAGDYVAIQRREPRRTLQ